MGSADYDRAKMLYPSTTTLDEAGWAAYFETPAGDAAFARLLGDIYSEVCALEDRDTGQVRIGRRRARPAVPLDEVMAKVFPVKYSMDPFPIAYSALLAGRSERAFAARLPISRCTLMRARRGQSAPDLGMLEAIATAARVAPFYFLEYRAGYVATLIGQVLTAAPHLSVRAVRELKVPA